ncbi:uncharacterized protein LKV04_019575 [Tautogolabrus adspersus]
MSVCEEDVELQSWGWTDLSSYSSALLDSEKEQHIESFLQTGIMSRRSLRLNDGLLDRSLPHGSASFSVGGAGWRSNRSLKSCRSQQLSASCSESLLHTPRKQTGHSFHNSSLHSVASDASLISSMLDESSIQETTLVDTLWGLDQDMDPKESTIISEQSTVLADRTLMASDGCCPKHQLHMLSRVYCKDCDELDRKEPVHCSSALKYPASSSSSIMPPGPETSIIYSRKSRTDVLQLIVDSSVLCVRRAAACCVCVLTHTWQVCRGLALKLSQVDTQTHSRHRGRSSHCRVMNLKESTTNKEETHPNGSLCNSAAGVCTWLSRRWRRMITSFPLNRQERREEQLYEEPLYSRPADTERGEEVLSRPDSHEDPAALDESVLFVRLEQSLTTLWERVEAGGRREEQRHREVLHLYAELQQQQQVPARSDGEERWLSDLMETQLEQLRTRVEEERLSREQTRQQDLLQQQSESTRLDALERQLHTLAARTQEFQWRQEAATTGSPSPTLPAAVSSPSVGVDRQSHDALLAEVARLEAALEDVRRDVEGLSACDGCREIDRIQQTVSAQVSSQVREEVRSLVYGNGLALRGGASADLPESLLQWLSQQYVSGADLQGALASLELSILQNISLQLEQRGSDDTLRETVLNAAGAAGAAVTKEDVHLMVTNALRLFSQDRTGLADYALESGGGSILSTRCSETYETKAALLSLFGVPLWYFSQSPRVVIQPDVHPGNCWAFRGSTGFLVIRLSMGIVPTTFSLEHIPKALAPSGTLRSAPRDFSVYGLDDEGQERGKLLGTYTYDEDGESLQSYPVSEENEQAFQIIEVQVLSNWGHEEYTCLYRFRVHGTPADV